MLTETISFFKFQSQVLGKETQSQGKSRTDSVVEEGLGKDACGVVLVTLIQTVTS